MYAEQYVQSEYAALWQFSDLPISSTISTLSTSSTSTYSTSRGPLPQIQRLTVQPVWRGPCPITVVGKKQCARSPFSKTRITAARLVEGKLIVPWTGVLSRAWRKATTSHNETARPQEMSMSTLQNPRQIRQSLLAIGTMVLLICSIPASGQVPSTQSELPGSPTAEARSSTSWKSNTTHDGSDEGSSIKFGRETLTEQADYFVPMTNRQRWEHFAYSLVQPQALLYTAVQAGLNQAQNTPHEWGQGARGYGRRFGSVYGEHLIGSTVGNAIAFGLHEDNRYFKSERTGVGRLSYAITSTILARHDEGSRFISFSGIGGSAAGAFSSRSWQPRSTHSTGEAAVSFGYALAERAGINVVREFSPRWLERILK